MENYDLAYDNQQTRDQAMWLFGWVPAAMEAAAGDPEYFEGEIQEIQEPGNMLVEGQLVDSGIGDLGNGPKDKEMIAAYMSGDGWGKSLEGETGILLRENGVDVEKFDQQYYGESKTPGKLGNPIGQTDIETPNTIVEVKSGDEWLTKYNNQVNKLQTNTTINPSGKAVVVYAPEMSDATANLARSQCGCTVLNSPEQIIEYNDEIGF